MKNNKFDADGGLANIEKLPDSLRGPLKEGVTKCRNADAGTVWNHICGDKIQFQVKWP
jgi:hypothetical protein